MVPLLSRYCMSRASPWPGFDRIRSVVEVDLMDGKQLTQPADEKYRGGPERPFTREELEEKFSDCAQLVLPEKNIREAIRSIESLERIKNINEVIKLLCP